MEKEKKEIMREMRAKRKARGLKRTELYLFSDVRSKLSDCAKLMMEKPELSEQFDELISDFLRGVEKEDKQEN